MDVRVAFVDGIGQAGEWIDEALAPLTTEQVNHLPQGDRLSIGQNAWHIFRTMDNVTNFVLRREQPIWLAKGYVERFDLPKVEQGTGMDIGDARALKVNDPALLREYGRIVFDDTIAFVRDFPLDDLETVQRIKPMGELPKWRIIRQVLMTHNFLHLGEINAVRGDFGFHAQQ